MTVQAQQYTAEEFDHLVALPENADRRLEFVGGEIIEMVSNQYSSHVATRIIRRLAAYRKSAVKPPPSGVGIYI